MTPAKLATLLTTIAVLVAAPARAQDAGDTTLAEALFRDGRQLMEQKKYDEACPKFEESQRLAPKLGTLLNLATCHDKQGKTGSAWGEYTKAISLAKEVGEEERVEYARTMLAELEPRLTKLVVEVPEPVSGVEVLIDDRAIGKAAWRTPIPLDPGPHEVVARAPGYATWSETVTLEPGPATKTVKVPKLAASGDPFAVEEEADEGGLGGVGIAGIVVGVVGLAGIGVGSYFGVDAFDKQGDSEEHCEGSLCDQEGVDLRDGAETSATISTVCFVVGLAALGTGVTLLIVDASGGRGGGRVAARPPARGQRLRPRRGGALVKHGGSITAAIVFAAGCALIAGVEDGELRPGSGGEGGGGMAQGGDVTDGGAGGGGSGPGSGGGAGGSSGVGGMVPGRINIDGATFMMGCNDAVDSDCAATRIPTTPSRSAAIASTRTRSRAATISRAPPRGCAASPAVIGTRPG